MFRFVTISFLIYENDSGRIANNLKKSRCQPASQTLTDVPTNRLSFRLSFRHSMMIRWRNERGQKKRKLPRNKTYNNNNNNKKKKKIGEHSLPCRKSWACNALLECWASKAWSRKGSRLRAIWPFRNLSNEQVERRCHFPGKIFNIFQSKFKSNGSFLPSNNWWLISTWRVSNRLNKLINVAKRVHGVPAGLQVCNVSTPINNLK